MRVSQRVPCCIMKGHLERRPMLCVLLPLQEIVKALWTCAEKCLLHSLKGTHAGSIDHAVAALSCAGLLFLAPPGIKLGAIASL